MSDVKIKAGAPVPPSVKPMPQKSSTQAGILLNDIERAAMGGKSPAVAQAIHNLERAITAEKAARQKLALPPIGPPLPPVAPPSAGSDNGPMDARLSKLEALAEKTGERLVVIEQDLAVLKGDLSSFKQEAFRAFATKTDLAEAKNSIILWVVSAVFIAQLLPALLKKFGL